MAESETLFRVFARNGSASGERQDQKLSPPRGRFAMLQRDAQTALIITENLMPLASECAKGLPWNSCTRNIELGENARPVIWCRPELPRRDLVDVDNFP